jgi:hypothetical protein
MNTAFSQTTRAKVRQQSLRRMCLGTDGKTLTKDARLVLALLERFCNGTGREPLPRAQGTGALDPLAIAQMAGRRQVFDLLTRMLSVKLEDRHNLGEEL